MSGSIFRHNTGSYNIPKMFLILMFTYSLVQESAALHRRENNHNRQTMTFSQKVDAIYGALNLQTMTLSQKIDAMDSKLSGVIEKQNADKTAEELNLRLDAIDEKLGIIMSQFRQNKTKEDTHYDNAVILISIKRAPTSEGNRFTFQFTKNTNELSAFYYNGEFALQKALNLTEKAGNIWEASFVCQNVTGVSCYVEVRAGSYGNKEFIPERKSITISLNTSTNNNTSTYMFGSLPVININPPEAVYEPGHDISIRAFVLLNESNSRYASHFFSLFSGINLTTGMFYMNFDREQFMRSDESAMTDKKQERNYTLKTSTHPVSGIFSFYTYSEFNEDDIVETIQISSNIRVRPSNQTDTLPPGYIGIVQTSVSSPANGHEIKFVPVGEEKPRKLYCRAVGEHVKSVDVFEVLGNGTLTPVVTLADPHSTAVVHVVSWPFRAMADSGNEDGITTFKCVAQDRFNKTVSIFIDVQATLPKTIDGGMSNITVTDVPGEPNQAHLVYNCAIRGRPLPDIKDITFSFGVRPVNSVDHGGYHNPADSMVTTGRNQAVATLELDVEKYDLLRIVRELIAGRGELPACNFFSPAQGDWVQYDFGINDSFIFNWSQIV